jgi:hypothetical protein
LGGQQGLHPLRPVNAPLQPHPSIDNIPLHPQPDPINDGWETKKTNLFLEMQNGPTFMKNNPNLDLLLPSIVASTNSFAQNQPYIEIKSSSLKFPIMKKERIP